MKSKGLENSVKNLTNLYTVVIGVALSLAIVALVDKDEGLKSVTLASIMLFVSFVSTLLPFYHGALRHLDDAYIENDNEHIKSSALIIDFILLFLHGIGFVILSLLLSIPSQFIWVLIMLLSVDVFWGLFVHFGASSLSSNTAEWKWTFINLVFVAITILYLVCSDIYLKYNENHLKLSTLIMTVCMLRSIVDYVWCRSFYFPKGE